MRGEQVRVYVPTPGSTLERAIKHGSGIVGTPEGERVMIDFEGAIYGQSGMARWADRVLYAADRHGTHAPTVARAWIEPEELMEVGVWFPADNRIRLIVSPESVKHWVDLEGKGEELVRSGYDFDLDFSGGRQGGTEGPEV